ncbi:MAG: PA0069 family radical SAM protein [Gammaproteobacteria bacterium]
MFARTSSTVWSALLLTCLAVWANGAQAQSPRQTQGARPTTASEGAPIVWGGSPSVFDMRSGTTPMGAVGTWMIDCGYVQIGKALNMPTHAYLDMSPGLDFETRLVAKPDAPALLRKELARRNYMCRPIALGSNTDPYQPIERSHCITRQLLEVLLEHRHPVAIVTKSAMVERDIDILSQMAKHDLVQVMISVCTLDKQLARLMEPRASTPQRRLRAMARLREAGIPVGVLAAPMIPVLNDPELETVLQQSAAHGARTAGYVLLRLPLEVAPLFEEWLHKHYPLKAEHVLTRIRDTREGALYRSEFGQRMQGSGAFAEIIARRFETMCQRLDLGGRELTLNTELFRVPAAENDQLTLF